MAIHDDYPETEESAIGASKSWAVITPDDDNDLAFVPKYIEVGATGGNVVCHDADGNAATFYFNPGEWKPIRPRRILATDTTATPIIAHRKRPSTA